MKRAAPQPTPQTNQTPLFQFNLTPSDPPRRWQNVVNRTRFRATLSERRAPTSDDNVGEQLTEALRDAVLSQARSNSGMQSHHLFHFTMQSDHFSHAFQSTTFTVRELEEDSERFRTYLQSLADKLNSNEDFEPDDSFTMEMTLVRTPGSGRGKPKTKLGRSTLQTLLKNKKSIIEIRNKDELCCARAIVTMKAWADVGGDTRHPDYRELHRGGSAQQERAKALHRNAGVREGPCGVAELNTFQAFLSDYQIKVMSIDKPHMVTFRGPESQKKILLIKVDDHYHGCNSFSGFLERSYFCHQCDKGYSNEDYDHHKCRGRCCPSCHRMDCQDHQEAKARSPVGEHPHPQQTCPACNRSFFGDECYGVHLHSADPRYYRSDCEHTKKCPSCRCTYDAAPIKKNKRATNRHRHRCGFAECPFCENQVDQSTHRCYIQPVDPEDDEVDFKKVPASEVGDRVVVAVEPDGKCWVEKNTPLFVYADYEAMTDDAGLQTPILVCAESEEDDDTSVFYGEDCTEQFFDYLDEFTVDEYGDDRKVIVIFHNFKGYDGMFVLRYLYEQHREVENQITIGTKVLSLQNGLITFKDSLCFLPFPLASFPATFGLTEQCKGFFPHLFNTAENQEYAGPIPDTHYYDPDGMSHKKKADFLLWHSQLATRRHHFVLKDEMEQYCISDVKLLKAGCEKFQAQFEKHTQFKPMEKCITIASACNRFWRKKLLPVDTIAVEAPRGWFGAVGNTSLVARQWLSWENERLRSVNDDEPTQPDRIRTSTNGGEVRIFTPNQSFLVDGFDAATNAVYEFNGCLWHGCPKCFPSRNLHSKLNRDRIFGEMYEATQHKADILQQAGYQVNSMWECRWRQLKIEDEDLSTFLSHFHNIPPLNPRDAFFGGRTNAVTLYYVVDPETGEKIFYVDVTSLYPWVNAEGEYPIGHPNIITNPENQDISNYFGMALVDILPPHDLFHPVLPHRQGGKLTFPLCAKCVQEEMVKPMAERSYTCLHSDDERTLRGTWCTPEIEKAVEKGYKVIRIHEVWHFQNRVKGLFKDYVNQWLKVKQESAGYPSWADTEEKKTEYRDNYKRHQGIELDPDEIAKNPGRKATAKLMLNSFWGKFGENLNKPHVQPITTPAGLFQLLYKGIDNVERIRICTPDLLEVVTREPPDNQLDNGKRNIFVAAFTTCYARLKLYSYLDLLKEQVLYFDTDSVVYTWKPGQPRVELGDYLGEMTDELEGDTIVEFVSGGPKNYGYKTESGKVCCKVRGFTLNVRGEQQLNYDVMKQNILAEIRHPLDAKRLTDVDNPHFFTRDPVTKRLKVIPRTKKYALVFDKRVVDPRTFRSFPYGYSQLEDRDLDLAEMLADEMEVVRAPRANHNERHSLNVDVNHVIQRQINLRNRINPEPR